MLDSGCWIIDAGYTMLNAGYLILDVRSKVFINIIIQKPVSSIQHQQLMPKIFLSEYKLAKPR
jgi:hypothetical protein